MKNSRKASTSLEKAPWVNVFCLILTLLDTSRQEDVLRKYFCRLNRPSETENLF